MCLLTVIFFISLIGYAKESAMDLELSVLQQIETDWSTVPFVDIYVSELPVCPDDTTEVFMRPFHGL